MSSTTRVKTIRSDLREPRLYLTAAIAAALGLLGALLTVGFIRALDGILDLLWTDLPDKLGTAENAAAYVVPVCLVGGVLVGAARRRLGEHPKSLEEALADFRQERAFDYRHIPQAAVLSLLSLGFGAALGPEAALVAIIGGLSSLVARYLQTSAVEMQALTYAGVVGSLGALFSTPGAAALPVDDEYARDRPGRVWLIVPGIAAGGAGVWLFSKLSATDGYFEFDYRPYEFAAADLGWAALAALAGTAVALLFTACGRGTDRIAAPLASRPVLQSALGGLALGLLAVASSLVLFSGREGIQELLDDLDASVGFLLGIVAAKMVAANLCLSTGWKGGRFFPIIFLGAAAGLALSELLPSVPSMVGAAACMTAVVGGLIRKPFATALFMLLLFPADLYPSVLIAAVVSTAVAKRIGAAYPGVFREEAPAS